jgi:hypothetical protein
VQVEHGQYPQTATVCPAGVTATELPHDPGNATGDDHEAASAGSTGETPNTAAPASATAESSAARRLTPLPTCRPPGRFSSSGEHRANVERGRLVRQQSSEPSS